MPSRARATSGGIDSAGSAEQDGDVGWVFALDLGVPQDQPPGLGQRRERSRGRRVLEVRATG